MVVSSCKTRTPPSRPCLHGTSSSLPPALMVADQADAASRKFSSLQHESLMFVQFHHLCTVLLFVKIKSGPFAQPQWRTRRLGTLSCVVFFPQNSDRNHPHKNGVGTLFPDLSLGDPGCFIGPCKAHPGSLRMASFSKEHVPSTIFTM